MYLATTSTHQLAAGRQAAAGRQPLTRTTDYDWMQLSNIAANSYPARCTPSLIRPPTFEVQQPKKERHITQDTNKTALCVIQEIQWGWEGR